MIVLVRPGVSPILLDDGRWTLSRTTDPSATTHAASENLAATLEPWHIERIGPTIDPAPKNTALARELGLDRFFTISVPLGSDTPALAAAIAHFDSLVEEAEPDALGRVDTPTPDWRQWGLFNTGQVIQGTPGVPNADCRARRAWTLRRGSPSITIAILDTGVSQSHPNLAGIQVPGASFDPNRPGNTDDNGTPSHGTICAGIAAAASVAQNSYLGVAFGVRIMPIKVAVGGPAGGSGTVGAQWAANGIIWATDHGAQVASMSFSLPAGTLNLSVFSAGCQYARNSGIFLCASSGNTPGGSIGYPARWPYVVCVGATTNTDALAPMTTTGADLDLCAPGQDIWSCIDENPALGGRGFDTFAFDSGTSMAAPHVAGVAALLLSADPTISAERVRQLIETTAEDLGPPGWDPQFGWGRINAERALEALLGVLACESDFDENGTVSPADVAQFIGAWTQSLVNGSLVGDFDGSGTVEPADVSRFLAVWFSELLNGC